MAFFFDMNILEKFENKLIKLYEFCAGYPKTIIASFLILSLSFTLFIPKLLFYITTENLVDRDSLAGIRFERIREDFPTKNSLYVYFYSDHPFKGSELCKIDEWLRFQGRNNPEISAVRSPFLLRKTKLENEKISYPYLLPPPCAKENLERIYSFAEIDKTPWRQVFTSRNDLFFGVEVLFHDTQGGSPFGDFDPNILGQFKNNLDSFLAQTFPNIKAHFLGHMGYYHYGLMGFKQTNVLNFVLIFVLILLCRFTFGTVKSGLLLTATLALMGGFLYGGMALTGSPVDSLNVGLFLILTIAVIEDFFFVSIWQLNNPNSDEELFKKFILPCFLTSLTTMIGFGSLCLTDLAVIRRFGAWATFGTFVEFLIVFFLLPALIKVFPALRVWTNKDKALFKHFSHKLLDRQLPRFFLKPLLLVGVLAIFSLPQLKIADAPYEIFPKDSPFRIGLDKIQENTGWQATFDMIFNDRNDRAFNEEILKKIQQHSLVSFIQNPYDIEQFYTLGLPPLSQELVLREYSLTPEYKRYVSADSALHAIVFVKANRVEQFNAFVKEIEQWCEDGKRCYPTGEIIAYAELAMKIPLVLLESFLYSVLLVSLTMLFILWQTRHWSFRNAVSLITSCLWGPMIMILLFWAFNVSLNFVTCVFASVLVGLTGDNAIQFLFSARNKSISEGIEQQGSSSIHIALITLMTSLVFLASDFAAMRTLGILTAVGILIMNLGDIWLFKGLLKEKPKAESNSCKKTQ